MFLSDVPAELAVAKRGERRGRESRTRRVWRDRQREGERRVRERQRMGEGESDAICCSSWIWGCMPSVLIKRRLNSRKNNGTLTARDRVRKKIK